ncbi:MAG: NYN domain-containing protein [Anaerolineae bacterium]
MTIWIDGHNLIGKMPGLWLDQPDDEEQLLERLRAYRARTGKRLVVYFDHGVTYQSPVRWSKGGISVRQAGSGQSADALMIRDLRRHHHPPELTIVTSDHAIQRVARQLKARVIDSMTFATELTRPPQKGNSADMPPLSEEEVKEWLTIFGQADE